MKHRPGSGTRTLQACWLGQGARWPVVAAIGWGGVWTLILMCQLAVAGEREVVAAQRAIPVAQNQVRIIDERPFDRLQVKEPGKEEIKTLKLVPLELKKRRPITKRPADDERLIVRLLSRPEQQYQVRWQYIDKIQLYEELVLEEAATLVDQKRFDEAYEYYRFVEQRAPDFPGVKAAFHRCLLVEAAYWHQQERDDQALALLNELHSQNPDFAGLPRALELIADKLIERDLASGKPAAARQLLVAWEQKFPNQPQVAIRKQQLLDLATQTLEQARQALAEKRLHDAYTAARAAVGIWPLEDAERTLNEIRAAYPVVVVGVREPGRSAMHASTLNRSPVTWAPATWADRRQHRLLHRRLAEQTGYDDGHLRYSSPLADWVVDGSTLTVKLRAGSSWQGGFGALSSYDVARSLVEATSRDTDRYRAELPGRMGTITAVDPQTVRVELRSPFPELGVLLHQDLVPWAAASREDRVPTLGPYSVAAPSPDEVRFELRDDYFAVGPHQPREITERILPKIRQALSELTAGEILALDRVLPWELPAAAGRDSVRLGAYPVPTVHFLIAGPRLSQVADRRGINFGINRPKILADALLEKNDASLGEVLSGPFPRGAAYNDAVSAAAYDARMMLALAQLATEPGNADERRRPLRLAYWPSAVASRACRAIQDHLTLGGHGLPIELLALPVGTSPTAETWDLLYVEWAGMEPIADAHRLFDAGGLCPLASSRLQTAVERLSTRTTTGEAEQSLREIHALVAEELPVIPLWQLREHFAYHASLSGIGDQPVTLYQNVEQWQIAGE